MNLSEARENYYFHTGKASEINRQLALGGIAIIWLFKSGTENSTKIPPELVMPLLLITLGLALDLFHYIVGSVIWGMYARCKEKKLLNEEEIFEAPSFINWPAILLFFLKISAVAAAYIFLLTWLAKRIV